MLKNEIVRIRQKRYFAEQKMWVFIGRVISMNDVLVHIEGKGLLIYNPHEKPEISRSQMSISGEMKGQTLPVDVDEGLRSILIPMDNIANIRILPQDFDLDTIHLFAEGRKIGLKVQGDVPTWIGEFGES